MNRKTGLYISCIVLLAAMLTVPVQSYSQIKTNIKLTEKTQRRVNTAKAARDDLRKLTRKERRAELKQRKEEELAWKLKSDSIRAQTLYEREYRRQWTMAEEKYTDLELVKLYNAGLLDFDTIPETEKWDKFLLEELMQNKELLNINEIEEFEKYVTEWESLQSHIKEATAENPIPALKDPQLEQLGYEGEAAAELQSHFREIENLNDQERVVQEGREKGVSKGREMLAEHTPEVEAAQKKLSTTKRKYSWLPSSNDLSLGQEENSLMGVPIKERLVWGGYLQVVEGKPVRVDFSPQLSYFFNKKISVGIGFTYRFVLGKRDSVTTVREAPSNAIGGRVFSEMKFIYGFHFHGEYEALKTSKTELFGDRSEFRWNHGLMLGIGKTVNLTKGVKTGILVMYNFLHKKDGPYPRPWIIRFGFQF